MNEDSYEQELGFEGEKKEGSPRSAARTALEILQEGIPSELKDKVYKDEGQLWEAQEKIGLSDLQILLNDEGYAFLREIPGPEHNAAVRKIGRAFDRWKHEQGAVLFGEKEADVFVSRSFERNKKRCPDFAIWGPDRLDQDGDAMGNADLGKAMNPHVIIQFSWGNKLEKETLVVDDMSFYAGLGDLAPLGRPNVLYLIKAKRQGDPNPQPEAPVHGFDVYVVRQGEHTSADPNLTYRVGGNENFTVDIAPEDMGLPQDANANPFSISLSAIRTHLENGYGVVFEAENQDG